MKLEKIKNTTMHVYPLSFLVWAFSPIDHQKKNTLVLIKFFKTFQNKFCKYFIYYPMRSNNNYFKKLFIRGVRVVKFG